MRMSFVIVLAFIVCWAPYYIVFIYITFLETVIDPIVFLCFSFIGLSNSMLNPMIYGAFQLCKVQFYASRFVPRSCGRALVFRFIVPERAKVLTKNNYLRHVAPAHPHRTNEPNFTENITFISVDVMIHYNFCYSHGPVVPTSGCKTNNNRVGV